MKELERECHALRGTNARAEQRVADLGTDLEGFESLTRDDAEGETVLEELEKQLGELRQGFEEYRGRQGKVGLEKDAEIVRLRQ